MIVLAASAAVDAFAGHREVAHRIAGEEIHTPHLLDVEVASALRRLTLTGHIGDVAASAVLGALARADLVRHEHVPLLGPIWALRATVSSYDAPYVALATALGAPLVTTDRRLAAAPDLPCIVEVF